MLAWDTTGLNGAYEIVVVVDPANTLSEVTKANNVARRAVHVLPAASDTQPPRLWALTVNGGAAETDRPGVTVALNATDSGGAGLRNMILIEREFNASARMWVPVQSTGWIPYQPVYTMTLTQHGGTHYVQGWVADGAGNISADTRLARIDYLPAFNRVLMGQVRVYQREWSQGQRARVMVQTLSGDADLYVWSPDGLHAWISAAEGLAADGVDFIAPTSGVYLIEVYGYRESAYRMSVSAGGARAATAPGAPDAKPTRSQPIVAPSSQPDGRAGIPAAPQPRGYLPMLTYALPPATTLQYLPLVAGH
jgi:hypothetical protein